MRVALFVLKNGAEQIQKQVEIAEKEYVLHYLVESVIIVFNHEPLV